MRVIASAAGASAHTSVNKAIDASINTYADGSVAIDGSVDVPIPSSLAAAAQLDVSKVIGVRGRIVSAGTYGAGVLGAASGVSSNLPLDPTTSAGGKNYGLYGIAAGLDDYGVMGVNESNVLSSDGTGSSNNSTGFGVYSYGDFAVAGAKSASVPTTQGNQLVYTIESPEMWFEDLGMGKLVNGEATIELDELFRQTVTIDDKNPMYVFLQELGECKGIYPITDKTRFLVKEKDGGRSNVSFSYRVMAKRRFYENWRFGYDPTFGPVNTLEKAKPQSPRLTDPQESERLIKQERELRLLKMQQQKQQAPAAGDQGKANLPPKPEPGNTDAYKAWLRSKIKGPMGN